MFLAGTPRNVNNTPYCVIVIMQSCSSPSNWKTNLVCATRRIKELLFLQQFQFFWQFFVRFSSCFKFVWQPRALVGRQLQSIFQVFFTRIRRDFLFSGSFYQCLILSLTFFQLFAKALKPNTCYNRISIIIQILQLNLVFGRNLQGVIELGPHSHNDIFHELNQVRRDARIMKWICFLLPQWFVLIIFLSVEIGSGHFGAFRLKTSVHSKTSWGIPL